MLQPGFGPWTVVTTVSRIINDNYSCETTPLAFVQLKGSKKLAQTARDALENFLNEYRLMHTILPFRAIVIPASVGNTTVEFYRELSFSQEGFIRALLDSLQVIFLGFDNEADIESNKEDFGSACLNVAIFFTYLKKLRDSSFERNNKKTQVLTTVAKHAVVTENLTIE